MQGISIDHNDNAIEKFKKHFTLNFWGFKYAGAIIKIDCYLVHCQIAQHNIKGLAKELQLQVFMRGSKKKIPRWREEGQVDGVILLPWYWWGLGGVGIVMLGIVIVMSIIRILFFRFNLFEVSCVVGSASTWPHLDLRVCFHRSVH